MLHEVGLHDVTADTKQIFTERLHLAKTARDEIINSLRENKLSSYNFFDIH